MHIIADVVAEMAGKRVNDNMVSLCLGLQKGGVEAGLVLPHRFAMFMAQVAHETARFKYDREVWGPTPAQKRYEGRKDLGNTQPGDGALFRGYTGMQITGRLNTTKFYTWCKSRFEFVPNFIKEPHLMNSDPWEGIAPIWYWMEGKPVSLNVSADAGDFVTNTKLVNGGYNGINDRYDCYGRAALVLLDMDPDKLNFYQAKKRLKADNIMGPNTLKALHKDLLKLPSLRF